MTEPKPGPSPDPKRPRDPEPDQLPNDRVHGRQTNMSGRDTNIWNINNHHASDSQSRPRLADGQIKEIVWFKEQVSGQIFRDQLIEEGIAKLKLYHWMCFYGVNELGKASTLMQLLVTWYSRVGSSLKIGLIVPPRQDQSFDPLTAAYGYEGRDCVFIFPDVLTQGNPDIKNFFAYLDEGRAEDLSRTLKEKNIFFLFSLDWDASVEHQSGFLRVGACVDHKRPAKSLLKLYLQKRISQNDTPFPREVLDKVLTEENQHFLVETAESFPFIGRFFREYLDDVVQGRISFHQIGRVMHSLDYWLFDDLRERVDIWSYTIALLLCQSHESQVAVPWRDFLSFRQLLFRALIKEIDLENYPEKGKLPYRDRDIFGAGRILVERHENDEGSVVRFPSQHLCDHLWSLLLTDGLALLCKILPFIQTCAEKDMAENSWLVKTAVSVLGRIGAADMRLSDQILLKFKAVEAGISEEETRIRIEVLKAFIQGILGSNNKPYRERVFKTFRDYLFEAEKSRSIEVRDRVFEKGKMSDQDMEFLSHYWYPFFFLAEWDLPAFFGNIEKILEKKVSEEGTDWLKGIQGKNYGKPNSEGTAPQWWSSFEVLFQDGPAPNYEDFLRFQIDQAVRESKSGENLGDAFGKIISFIPSYGFACLQFSYALLLNALRTGSRPEFGLAFLQSWLSHKKKTFAYLAVLFFFTHGVDKAGESESSDENVEKEAMASRDWMIPNVVKGGFHNQEILSEFLLSMESGLGRLFTLETKDHLLKNFYELVFDWVVDCAQDLPILKGLAYAYARTALAGEGFGRRIHGKMNSKRIFQSTKNLVAFRKEFVRLCMTLGTQTSLVPPS